MKTVNNKKKDTQLEMSHGTATHQLRKSILFKYVKLAGHNMCHQCNKEIKDINEFSIEHKIPWLDSNKPIDLFFDLNNISFSHLICNIGAARKTRVMKHPSTVAYQAGCRCQECRDIEANRRREQRLKGIKT